MSNILQLKRGTTADVAAYVPVVGEPVFDRELNILTIGGFPLSQVATALKLHTARTIALSGTVTGSGLFDGSGNLTITTSVGTSLQTSLDAKAPLASPALTGTPTGTTAPVDTNSTRLATTAFVVAQASSSLPVVDGTAAIGTSLRYARADHVHPTDTSRAPLNSPGLTGTPTAPTPAVGTNTTQVATAAMVQAEIANKRAWTSYTPVITPTSGTFTTVSATGEYMVEFGICHVIIKITMTTKGTGTFPMATLPVVGKTGANGVNLIARVGATGKMGYGILTFNRDQVYIAAYDASDLSVNGADFIINGSYPVA
jgi:hypothetical protein